MREELTEELTVLFPTFKTEELAVRFVLKLSWLELTKKFTVALPTPNEIELIERLAKESVELFATALTVEFPIENPVSDI